MLSRRDLLASTAAATAVAFVLPDFVARADAPASSASQLNVLMDNFFQENLQQNPEGATLLGLDKGSNAGLKSKLRDESAAGIAASNALNASQLARLKALDAGTLASMDRVNYDTLVYVGESRAQETRYPGIWWVTHRNEAGDTVAELIEVCTIPAILRAPAEDVADGAVLLRQALDNLQESR